MLPPRPTSSELFALASGWKHTAEGLAFFCHAFLQMWSTPSPISVPGGPGSVPGGPGWPLVLQCLLASALIVPPIAEPLKPAINQRKKNAPQAYPWGNPGEEIPQLNFPLACIKLTKTNQHI